MIIEENDIHVVVKKLERPIGSFEYYGVVRYYQTINGERVCKLYPEMGEEYGSTYDEAFNNINSRFRLWLKQQTNMNLKRDC